MKGGARARLRRSPPFLDRWIDRILALAGEGAPPESPNRLRVLRRFLLAWGAVRSWVWLAFDPAAATALLAVSAAVLSVAAVLRWLVAIVLFHTGLQKLLYGHYLSGDFLAFMVGRGRGCHLL